MPNSINFYSIISIIFIIQFLFLTLPDLRFLENFNIVKEVMIYLLLELIIIILSYIIRIYY